MNRKLDSKDKTCSIGRQTLINADCLSVLREMPSSSVDLVVTDPPYKYDSLSRLNRRVGHWTHAKGFMNHYAKLRTMNNGFNPAVLAQLIRVMKKINIYIWCSKKQFLPLMDYFVHRHHCFWTLICWHKTNPTPFCGGTYLSDTEYCLLFRQHGTHIYGNYHTKRTFYVTPQDVKDKRRWHHPTIKPLPIIKNLVVNSSRKGDVVLDPFLGSGTTLVATKQLGRKGIGVEINHKYYEIAKDRISKA